MSEGKVLVVGAGTMGNGIAQVFAQNGFEVDLVDQNDVVLDGAMGRIEKSLRKLAQKGVLPGDEVPTILGRITRGKDLNPGSGADLVVEAVYENESLKKKVFGELDETCPPKTVFASNTSSISITRLAAGTGRAERFIGMHFMNPVPLMKLVEVIRGHVTSDETRDRVFEICRKLGKTPVECNDYPGFVANRILLPMVNEAMYALMEGVGTREAIDEIMKLGANHPMGPLTLADFVGLDVCLHILEVLHEGLGDPKYRPCPLLRKMVDAGMLGRKSGRGFYEYT
jgi:3-hydroxybutyryl-CoA dehydrogenase